MKEIKKMYTLRIPNIQLEYLRKISTDNFTTVTQYIIDLINNDMKHNKNGKDNRNL